MRECDVAFNVGTLLKKYLDKLNFQTMLLQDDSLEKICYESNKFNADIFISIHCNAFNGRARGAETWYFYSSKNGAILADKIQNQLKSIAISRGTKPAKPGVNGLFVLTNTNAVAVLVELGFIDNSDDAVILHNEQDRLARCIACGVSDFFAKVS